jgi:hypothetical protein
MQMDKNSLNHSNQTAINGIDRHFSKGKSVPIDGTATALTEVKSILRDAIDATVAADAAHAQWQEKVARMRTTRAAAARVRRALRSYLLVHYGAKAVGILADFGFAPSKAPGPKTVRTKAEAVEKAKATREARHTMGKRQKEHIKGQPAADPPAPAPFPVPVPAPVPTNGASTNGAAVNGASK